IVAESDGINRQMRTVTPGFRSTTVTAPKREEAADSGLVDNVEKWLIDAVGALLKVRKQDIDLDAELSEFGFDSISLTGLANHVNRALDLELMPTIFFEHRSVRSVAAYLVEKHGATVARKWTSASEPAPAPASARPVLSCLAVQTPTAAES